MVNLFFKYGYIFEDLWIFTNSMSEVMMSNAAACTSPDKQMIRPSASSFVLLNKNESEPKRPPSAKIKHKTSFGNPFKEMF